MERDPKPTVCHVTFSLQVGGAEILATRLAAHARTRFGVVLACLDACGPLGEQMREAGYPLAVMERRPGFDPRCAWRLARYCRERDVALIHAHQYGPFFYSALARFLPPRIPVLFTEHGRLHPDPYSAKRALANRLLLRRGDRVVAVGEGVRRALIDVEGLPPERIQVVYNGVETAPHAPDPSLRREVREELGLEDSHRVAMQVARLDPIKDHATAIRAMAKLCAGDERSRLVLVGDGPERGNVEALLRALGLGDRVILLGFRADVARLLQGADVALLSSVSEGIPMALIEAMATSLPCVATDAGGTAEVVVSGETGLLARTGDPDDLADKLGEALADPEQRRRMGRAGRERVLARFTATAMERSYDRIYAEMLDRAPPAVSTAHREGLV